ncbi:MAG TPA: hypothetical protein VF543_18830 [Pyrinomonadaceae bacterium]|jgi:hypothetical protein
MVTDYKDLFRRLTMRYGPLEPEALEQVLSPVLIPIRTLDKTIVKQPNKPYTASFTIDVTPHNIGLLHRGRTGKFVPHSYVAGGIWNELAKGRIVHVHAKANIACGEVYVGVGSKKALLEEALKNLTDNDYLEMDRYGIAAKLLSGLTEYYLAKTARSQGYDVIRMPEDTARHVGGYSYYDFQFHKGGQMRRVEVKSLWGTDTKKARLIHGKSREGSNYKTSSCKFDTQDIFAVNLFLRTGNIQEFAFARSVPKSVQNPHGLPTARKHTEYVNQNPPCLIDNETWFKDIKDVW